MHENVQVGGLMDRATGVVGVEAFDSVHADIALPAQPCVVTTVQLKVLPRSSSTENLQALTGVGGG